MKLTIEAETAMELQHKVLALAALFTAGASVGALVNTEVELPYGSFEDEQVEVSSPEETPVVETKTPAKKRTRKPKAEQVVDMKISVGDAVEAPKAEAEAPATPDFNDAEEEKSVISISDIRQAAAEAETPAPASKEAAMEALTVLNGSKGLPVARGVLAQFKATRFSELKEENYGAFIQACRAA